MQMLQRIHIRLMFLQRFDAIRSSTSCSDRRDRRNALEHSRAANRLLVEECVLPVRRIYDEVDTLALDQVNDIRPAFLHFVDALYDKPSAFQHVSRPLGRDNVKAKLDILLCQIDQLCLVAIIDNEKKKN